ncbi:MAG: hypothetical protein AAF471_09080 [Myxococcota bacterium]
MARQKDRAAAAKSASGDAHVNQFVQQLRQPTPRQMEQVKGFVDALTATQTAKTPRRGWEQAFHVEDGLDDPVLQDAQYIQNHWDNTEWVW